MKPFHVAAETHDRVTDVPPSKSGGPVTLLSHRPHRISGSGGAAAVGARAPANACNPAIPSNSKTFITSPKICFQALCRSVRQKALIIEDRKMVYAYLLEFADCSCAMTMLTPHPAGHVPNAILDA
jgi:hypothetical protein